MQQIEDFLQDEERTLLEIETGKETTNNKDKLLPIDIEDILFANGYRYMENSTTQDDPFNTTYVVQYLAKDNKKCVAIKGSLTKNYIALQKLKDKPTE